MVTLSDYKVSLIILGILSIISMVFGVLAYLEPKDASDKIRLKVETVPRSMPRFTAPLPETGTDSLLERIVGISPETGKLSRGVRSKPYLSFSFIDAYFAWVTPFGTTDNFYIFGYDEGINMPRLQVVGWMEQVSVPGSTSEYTFRLDNKSDTTFPTTYFANMPTLPWGTEGILRVRGYTPNTNNCQLEYMTLNGDRELVVSLVDAWDWAGAPMLTLAYGRITRLSDTVIVITQSGHTDMNVIYVEFASGEGTPTVVTRSGVLTYNTTSRVKNIVGAVPGDEANYGIYVIHEHDNSKSYSRRWITWDGTANAPVVSVLENEGTTILKPSFTGTEFVESSHSLVLKDGTVLTVGGVGESQDRGNSLFYHLDFEAKTMTELEDDFEVTEGNGIARLLAYDPENETFLVSWLNPYLSNVLRLNFCRWNSAERRLDSLDELMIPGVPAASDAYRVSGNKYILVLRSGQLVPLWVSLEHKVMSFHPLKTRSPLGYMTADGEIIGDGWTVALPSTWEGLVETGTPLYTDLEGRVMPAKDQRTFGFSRAGYFLGNPTLMLLDFE